MNPVLKLAIWSVKCPKCSSEKIRWSHRRNRWEFFLSTVLRPYRCEECGQRWFRTHGKNRHAESEPADEKPPTDNH